MSAIVLRYQDNDDLICSAGTVDKEDGGFSRGMFLAGFLTAWLTAYGDQAPLVNVYVIPTEDDEEVLHEHLTAMANQRQEGTL